MGEDSDYSEPDLSWLPDPDKIYGNKFEDNNSEISDDCSNESSSERIQVKEGKRKLTIIKSVIPAKRQRSESTSDESDNEVLDTGLSLGEDEDLALKLLSR